MNLTCPWYKYNAFEVGIIWCVKGEKPANGDKGLTLNLHSNHLFVMPQILAH